MGTAPRHRGAHGVHRFVTASLFILAIAVLPSCRSDVEEPSASSGAPALARDAQGAVDRLATYVDRSARNVVVDSSDAADIVEVPDDSAPGGPGFGANAGGGASGNTDLLDTTPGPDPQLPNPHPSNPEFDKPDSNDEPHGRWVSLARPTTVRLPETAAQPFVVVDDDTGSTIDVRLVGVRDVAGVDTSGHRVFASAYDGGDFIVRAFDEGVEDYVWIETPPKNAVVRYEVTLGAMIAGLRLVANTLEFLDDGGAPRIRVAPPWLAGADGERIDASLAVSDCAVDTNPAAPWDRPVTDPGARACTVSVSWERDAVTYPAVLDPVWSTTGQMAQARAEHQMVRLSNGRVLITGGRSTHSSSPTSLFTSELFDFRTRTWSMASSLSTGRHAHSATVLSNGTVLVAGGVAGSTTLSSAQVYSPSNGIWTTVGSLATARAGHKAVRLNDGRVLVVGGSSNSGVGVSAAELYSASSSGWSTAGTGPGCSSHTATMLTNGNVLVICGETNGASMLTASIYSPQSGGAGSWSTPTTGLTSRYSRVVLRLQDGRVLVGGGRSGTLFYSTSRIASASGMTWDVGTSLPFALSDPMIAALDDGRHLVVGGRVGASSTSALSRLMNGDGSSWSSAPSMPASRVHAAMIPLPNSRAMLTGGDWTVPETTAWLFLAETPCSTNAQCASGICVAGQCCDTACSTGSCQSCSRSGFEGFCTLSSASETGSPSCSPYFCTGTGPSCRTSCTSASHCASGLCLNNVCILKSIGDTCSSGEQCSSGHCADGVCCNSACSGACRACSVAAGAPANGVCSILELGQTGHPSCEPYVCWGGANCPTSCSQDAHCDADHYCDGSRCVERFAQGASCTSASQCLSGYCSNGRCCDRACDGECELCSNFSGACQLVTGTGTPSCAPFVCTGSSGHCPTTCSSDDQCTFGNFCHQNQCIPKRVNGTSCTLGSQCISGNCFDDVCCNTGCSGSCQACSVAAGSPSDGTCVHLPEGHPGTPPCEDGFVCSGGSSCTTSCDSDAQCAGTHYCDGSICLPKQPKGGECSSDGGCTTGHCADGFCCDSACDGRCETCSAIEGAVATGTCTLLPSGSVGVPACEGGRVCSGDSGSCPTTCTTNDECADTHFCDGGECLPRRELGGACNDTRDCISGYCVDGVCCNGPCSSPCEFCSVAKGSAVDGVCSVGAGREGEPSCSPYLCRAGSGACPQGGCTFDGHCAANHWCDSGTCREKTPLGGACTAAAECATGHCVDGRCCDSACSGACDSCSVALGASQDGVCQPVVGSGSPSCWPFQCAGTSVACPTVCSSDSECTSTHYCREGACVVRRAQGSLCSKDSECLTDFCSDGRCCDSECDGPCSACATALGATANGVCTPIAGLAAPSCAPFLCDGVVGECPGYCLSSANCAPGHQCENGSCELKRVLGASCTTGAQCVSGHCSDGVCCDSACGNACDACSAALGASADGVCTYAVGEGSPSCAPFACNGSSPWCPSVCSSNAECGEGFHCSGFTCVPGKPVGAVCSSNAECENGRCVDGRCCSSACSGICERCDVEGAEGVCSPAGRGTEPRSACVGGMLCDGSLRGCPGSCLVGGSAVAGDAVCPADSWCGADGVCRPGKSLSASCDRDGECASGHCVEGVCCDSGCGGACASCTLPGRAGQCVVVPSGTPGSPACSDGLVCNGATAVCPSFCNPNDDGSCAPGHYCVNGLCAQVKANGEQCTRDGQCGSGNCVDNRCCDSACDGACDTCTLAGSVGQCVPRPAGSQGVPVCADGWTCDGENADCPVDCESDLSCTLGYHCFEGSCRADRVRGATCSEGRECASGHCVDGVCCDRECDGACEACTIAAGGHSNGTCSFAVGSGSPSCSPFACNGAGAQCPVVCSADADCASDHRCESGACVPRLPNGSVCDAGRVCLSGACVDGRCCNEACDGGCQACSVAAGSSADGVCAIVAGSGADSGSGSCAPYVCDGSAPDCPTSCVLDEDCAGDHWCSAGACVPTKDLGESCERERQCGSGNCVDEVCCDSACDGACEACSLSSGATEDGSCIVTALAPGRPSCAPFVCTEDEADCPESCSSDLHCNAATYCSNGSCVPRFPAGATCDAGNTCLSGSCVDGVCCDAACDGPCETCSAALGAVADGVCSPVAGAGAPSCAPYVCGGVGSGCLDACTSQADCAPGWFCGSDGRCGSSGSLGDACESDAQCESGHCADGVCCDGPCTEQCAACNLPGSVGVCRATAGPPVGDREPCASDDTTCGGLCDGIDPFACAYPDAQTTCGDAVCDDGDVLFPSFCDGAGACGDRARVACGPFACDDGACAEPCASNADCADDHVCRDGDCLALTRSGEACTSGDECSSGVCAGGFCCDGPCVGGCKGCGVEGREGECLPMAGDAGDSTCGPYRCDGSRPDCPTSCVSSEDCSDGNHCVGDESGSVSSSESRGRCRPKGEQGAACASDGECLSGTCSDGFCCDRACDGQCTSCGLPGSEGTCTRVIGAAAPKRDSCDGRGVCSGTCDGRNDDCVYPDVQTECGSAWCADGVLTAASVCDGKGFCSDAGTTECAYGCAGDRCRPQPVPRGSSCSATDGSDLAALALLLASGWIRLRRRSSTLSRSAEAK